MCDPPLAVLPVREGRLPAGAAEALALARGEALLVGEGTEAAARGLERAAVVRCAEAVEFRPGAIVSGIAPLVSAARYIVLPASSEGRSLAARLAFVLNRPFFANVAYADQDSAVTVRSNRWPDNQVVLAASRGVITVMPGADLCSFDLNPRRTEIRLCLVLRDVPDPRVLGLAPPSARPRVPWSGNGRP